MAAKFVKINGQMHDPEILEIAKSAGGVITIGIAEDLWAAAIDGAKVTDAEKRSVQHAIDNNKVEPDAKAFLAKKLAAQKKGCPSHLAPLKTVETGSQYKAIMGVKYEKDLLNIAVSATEGGNSMDLSTAERLYEAAMDGKKVTETEFRTIEFIIAHYQLDHDAYECLDSKLKAHPTIKNRKFKGVSWINESTIPAKTDAKPAKTAAPVKTPAKTSAPAATIAKKRSAVEAGLSAAGAGLDEKTCWDHIYGHCHRGDKCRYKHEGEVESGHQNADHARAVAARHDVEFNDDAIEELATLHENDIDEMIESLAAKHADVKNKSGWVIKAARRKRIVMAKEEHSEWSTCEAPKRHKGHKGKSRNTWNSGNGQGQYMWMPMPSGWGW